MTADLPSVAAMFAVHIESLRHAGTDLDSISVRLHSFAKSVMAEDLGGNNVLSAAMRSVEKDWSRQRSKICGYLSALSAGARSAAELYAAVERELVTTMSPAGPHGGGGPRR